MRVDPLPRPLRRSLLLYEHVCRWAASLVAKLDAEECLALLSIDEPEAEAEPWLAPPREEERRATWRVIRPDGRYVDDGQAAIALEALRPLRLVGRLERQLRLSDRSARSTRS
jgi:hypothetical protein